MDSDGMSAGSPIPGGRHGPFVGHPYRTFALVFACFTVFVLSTAKFRIDHESHLVKHDGFFYYVYARSLFFDHDVNFKNEYEDFGPLCMGKSVFPMSAGKRPPGLIPDNPQPSGAPVYGPWNGKFPDYPGNMWEVGSGILWLPFIACAHAMALALRAAGLSALPADGYSIIYECWVAVAASFYAFLGTCLAYKALRMRFAPEPAFWSALFMATATSLVSYVVYQVAYSHAQEFFAASLVFFLLLRRPSFDSMGFGSAALLGLAIGLTALVRWQMVLWGVVPLWLWLWGLATSARRGMVFCKGLVLGAAAAAAFLPQMIAWHSIYGHYVTLPEDTDWHLEMRRSGQLHGHFLMLRFKESLLVLFSNNHGMFLWHPITLVGFAGAVAALWRREMRQWRGVIALALVAFALEAIVNGMVPDWWAGGGFGMRRMIGMYPLIALGVAVVLSAVGPGAKRSIWTAIAWAAASAWNAALLFIWILHLGGSALPH